MPLWFWNIAWITIRFLRWERAEMCILGRYSKRVRVAMNRVEEQVRIERNAQPGD